MESRQSILMRPRKKNNSINKESIDLQYEKEQRRLEAKRARYEQLNEHRRKALFGDGNDKRSLQAERAEQIEHHLEIRREKMEEEKRKDKSYLQYANEQAVEISHFEHDQAAKKRAYLKSLMEENQRLIAYRQALKKQEIESEKPSEDIFERSKFRDYR